MEYYAIERATLWHFATKTELKTALFFAQSYRNLIHPNWDVFESDHISYAPHITGRSPSQFTSRNGKTRQHTDANNRRLTSAMKVPVRFAGLTVHIAHDYFDVSSATKCSQAFEDTYLCGKILTESTGGGVKRSIAQKQVIQVRRRSKFPIPDRNRPKRPRMDCDTPSSDDSDH